MDYLVLQIWMCLSLAAVLGALIGWLLAKASYQKKLNNREAEWQNRLEEKTSTPTIQSANKSAAPVIIAEIDEAVMDDVAEKSPASDSTSYDVEEVEGIGPNYGNKLRDMGILSTEQLLGQAYNMDGQMHIAEQIGIEDFVIRKWATMCDLMRLPGVDGQTSELMVKAGIDSVQDLGQQNAGSLLNKLGLSSNAEEQGISLPNEASLAQMINQAKSLKTIMRDD